MAVIALALYYFSASFFFVNSARLLAPLPFGAKSHYAFIDPILMKLVDLGHHVTVYTPFPKESTAPNYEQHDISFCPVSRISVGSSIDNTASMFNNKWMFASLFPYIANATRGNIMECEPLYTLLNTTEKKYDLLIVESFVSDVMLLYANKFRIPVVAYMPNVLLPWLAERLQNPFNPSYVPNLRTGYLPKMTFLQRVDNTLYYSMLSFIYNNFILKNSEEVNKQLLGPSSTSLYDTVKNTSILFVGSHHSFHPIVPFVPGIVEIAGIHIRPVKSLPTVCVFFLQFTIDESGIQ